MMKWLGLLLVVCSGGGIGFLYAMRLRQERTNLERLCQMLREIAVQIAFRSLTVQELLEQLCRETAYAAFQFPVTVLSGMEQGLPLAEAWAAAAVLQSGAAGRTAGGDTALLKGKVAMEIDLIFKIAGTGIIVAVLNLVLKRAEREEQAMMTTLAGLVVVLMLLVDQIGTLFERVKSVFGL